jgi:cation-transporting ATPase 13A2
MSVMQCDAVLLNGNVIVNESLLTGESLPITKVPLDTSCSSTRQSKLNVKDQSRHILFSGTQVIQTRYYGHEKLKAIVIRTGFNTTKGELVRSILHPKPLNFQFKSDLNKYVVGLFAIALGGIIYSLTLKIRRGNPIGEIIKRTLDIFIICIPPALPGALTACLAYAQNRLKEKNIYCICPSSINICGTLDTVILPKAIH